MLSADEVHLPSPEASHWLDLRRPIPAASAAGLDAPCRLVGAGPAAIELSTRRPRRRRRRGGVRPPAVGRHLDPEVPAHRARPLRPDRRHPPGRPASISGAEMVRAGLAWDYTAFSFSGGTYALGEQKEGGLIGGFVPPSPTRRRSPPRSPGARPPRRRRSGRSGPPEGGLSPSEVPDPGDAIDRIPTGSRADAISGLDQKGAPAGKPRQGRPGAALGRPCRIGPRPPR
jgi:hypothetical protein